MADQRKSELSAKERAFLAEYFGNGYNAKKAYLALVPDVEPHSAEDAGSKLLARIKKKTAGQRSWRQLVSTIFASLRNSMSFLRRRTASSTRGRCAALCLTTLFVCALSSCSPSFSAARRPTSLSSPTSRELSCNSPTNRAQMRQSDLILKPSPAQSRVLRNPARFKIINAGRRFGKTYLAIDFDLFPGAVNVPESNNWYVAPTYRMAKDIAWEELKRVVPKAYLAKKPNETELSVTLLNRSTIALKGADNPDSLRGPGLDRLVLDEAAYMKREVLDVTRPMLSDRNGSALLISTPAGYNWFYDTYSAALSRPNWAAFQFTTLQGGNVTAEEIAEAKQDLDERIFRQEYEASFEMLAGRVYYAYDRLENARKLEDIPGAPLLVGMDFNVNPMSAAIAVRAGDQLHFIDEILLSNGNTELLAQTIRSKYPGRSVRVYPDPTGNARKTSAPVGQTDFTILRAAGFTVLAPSHPYPVADKINTVNAAMKNAAGQRRVIVDTAKCPSLAKGLDGLTYREGTNDPDKSLGLDHITDAAAYLILWELPMRGSAGRIVLGAA